MWLSQNHIGRLPAGSRSRLVCMRVPAVFFSFPSLVCSLSTPTSRFPSTGLCLVFSFFFLSLSLFLNLSETLSFTVSLSPSFFLSTPNPLPPRLSLTRSLLLFLPSSRSLLSFCPFCLFLFLYLFLFLFRSPLSWVRAAFAYIFFTFISPYDGVPVNWN